MKLLLGESSGATGESVDCGGLCLSTFNDIRFTKSDGYTLLDYWIESLSGTTPNQLATIWIEFDSIGTTNTTFYMYYGKSDATSLSNGDNTFILFDDFNDNVVSSSKWINTGSFTESNGVLSKYAANTNSNFLFKSLSSYTAPLSIIIRTKVNSDWSNEYSWANNIHFENDWETTGFMAGHYKDGSLDRWYLRKIPGPTDDYSTGSIVANQYYQYRMDITDGSQKFYVDDVLKQSLTITPLPINTTNIMLSTSRASSTADFTTSFDWIIVKNCAVTEPLWGTWSTTLENVDSYTKLLIHGNRNLGLVDSATGKIITSNGGVAISSGKTITTYGNASIVSGRPVTSYGNAQLSTLQSKFGGSSGLFDGTDDRISVPASSDFDFGTGDFTIDFWVYFTSTTGYQYFFDIGNDNSHMYYYSGTWYIRNPAATTILSWTNTPSINTWIHVAIGRNGTNWFLFTDGVLRTIATSSLTYGISNLAFTVGGWGSGSSYGFKGYMDEFRVSKGILRWTTDFNVPDAPYETDSYTKLLLHFNDTTTFYDHSLCRPYFGDVGYFDGTNSYLTLADSDDWNFGNDAFTIDFWLYIINPPTHNYWLYVQYVDQSNVFAIGCGANDNNFFIRSDAEYKTFGPITLRKWHHLAVVKESASLTNVYTNGILISSTTSNVAYKNLNSLLYIGCWGSGGDAGPNGYMDEYRVSKGIARWTSNFTPPTVPYESDSYTKLLIHFNNVSGATTFYDYSITRPNFGESIYFNGSSSYLSLIDSDDWDFSGDFTIDFNLLLLGYSSSFSGSYGGFIIGNYNFVSTGNNGWQIRINGTSSSYTTINIYTGATDLNVSYSFSLNTQYHMAVVRCGDTIKVYINGTKVGSTVVNSDAFVNKNAGANLFIGKLNDATYHFYLNGLIDELRVSKGVARWISDFTPPISEYFTATILPTPTSKRPLCTYSGVIKELSIGDAIVIAGEYQLTYASTISIDFTSYDIQSVILTGDTIFTLNNIVNGKHCSLVVTQDSAGNRIATFNNTIKWYQGITPTLSTASSITDIFTFVKSRDTLYGYCSKAFQTGS
jgi:hypothetical protein